MIHVEQPREAIAAIGVHLSQRAEPLRLAALHVMTSLTGSALLALAVDFGELDAETAWSAAHVDEDFQAEHWGHDSEAIARRAHRKRDMMAAASVARGDSQRRVNVQLSAYESRAPAARSATAGRVRSTAPASQIRPAAVGRGVEARRS